MNRWLATAIGAFGAALILAVVAALDVGAQTMVVPCPVQPAPWNLGYHASVYTPELAAHHENNPPEYAPGFWSPNSVSPRDPVTIQVPDGCIKWPLGSRMNYALAMARTVDLERIGFDLGGPARALSIYDVSGGETSSRWISSEFYRTACQDWTRWLSRDSRYLFAEHDRRGVPQCVTDTQLLTAIGRTWGQRGRDVGLTNVPTSTPVVSATIPVPSTLPTATPVPTSTPRPTPTADTGMAARLAELEAMQRATDARLNALIDLLTPPTVVPGETP